MNPRVGVFIVIEGIDGAGKTLHSKNLCIQLHRRGFDTRYTTEPSEGFIGGLLRREFLNRTKIPPEMETLLFAADRFEHVQNVILPALGQNKIVVSDRYYYASIAYQGAQGVGVDWIRTVNSFAPKPDLALYLDVPVDLALSRIHRKKSLMENVELESRVREIYLDMVKRNELTYVDGNRSVEAVDRDVLDLTLKKISRRREGSST
ncbi:dTMP kinase [Candidatus Bathyarchaeota archaeon]|nr:dTMP kinase [Candidatus Bathyarchaeota archaeon]